MFAGERLDTKIENTQRTVGVQCMTSKRPAHFLEFSYQWPPALGKELLRISELKLLSWALELHWILGGWGKSCSV